jgi:TonB family protein
VNAGIVLLLALAGAFEVPKPMKQERVELSEVTVRDWERNREVRELTPTAPVPAPPPEVKPVVPPPPPPEDEKPDRPGPVVDTGPANDRVPDAARHASERNNRVEKETRSRWQGAGNFKNRAPVPIAGDTDRRRGGERGSDDESREAREGQRGTDEKGGKPVPESRPAPAEDRLALHDPAMPRPRASTPPRPGSDGDASGLPGLPGEPQEARRKSGDARLDPSSADMARITAGPSLDRLDPEIEEGDATALNTRSYRFATFWNRFKQDVGDHWSPGVLTQLEARDPYGTTYGRSDRVTGLRIVLDATGAVKEIEVVSPSGLEFLDRIAVKSVRDAAPFYNVPAGLLDAEGELSFEFGFLVGRSRGVPIRPRWGAP